MLRPLLLVLSTLVTALAHGQFTLDGGSPSGGAVAAGTTPAAYYMAGDGSGWYNGTSNGATNDGCTGPVTWAWT